jgi:hypothetical protein
MNEDTLPESQPDGEGSAGISVPGKNPEPQNSLLDESPVTKAAKVHFAARFESLRSGYKKAVKAPNGFLTGFVFAEAKKARDAGNFTAALSLLDELEDLIKLAEKKADGKARKTAEKFKADYKTFERKARRLGGAILQAAARHLKAAHELAEKKDFVKANRELDKVASICTHGPNPPAPATSHRSRPFTVTIIPAS